MQGGREFMKNEINAVLENNGLSGHRTLLCRGAFPQMMALIRWTVSWRQYRRLWTDTDFWLAWYKIWFDFPWLIFDLFSHLADLPIVIYQCLLLFSPRVPLNAVFTAFISLLSLFLLSHSFTIPNSVYCIGLDSFPLYLLILLAEEGVQNKKSGCNE